MENTQDSSLSMIKLLIVGDPQVGKSSLVTQFCSNTFISTYHPTNGVDFKYKMLDSFPKKIRVQIWDRTGVDHSNSLHKIYYKKAMGIVLVFSLEDNQSLHHIHTWMAYLQNHLHPNASVILVGNKSDSSKRAVHHKEILSLQQQFQIEKYVETSAKHGSNVNEAFTELVREIKEKLAIGLFQADEAPVPSKPIVKENKVDSKTFDQPALGGNETLINGEIESASLPSRKTVIEDAEDPLEKKMKRMFDLQKVKLEQDLKEILKKSQKNELESLVVDHIEKARKEILNTIILKLDRDQTENSSPIEKKDHESLEHFTERLENFRQSMMEETTRTNKTTNETLNLLLKENIHFRNKLAEIENSLKRPNVPEKPDILESLSQKRKAISQDFQDKLPRLSAKMGHESQLSASFLQEINLHNSAREYIEQNENSKKAFLRNKTLSENSSPTHLTTVKESQMLEFGSDSHKKKKIRISYDQDIASTFETLKPENVIMINEPRASSRNEDSFRPKSISVGYGAGEDEVLKNIFEMKSSLATLEEDVQEVQKKIKMQRRTKHRREHKRRDRIRATSTQNSEENIQTYLKSVENEMGQLWATINNLVGNIQEEILKIKDDFKVFKRSKFGSSWKAEESHPDKDLRGELDELRGDIHNQLIEIQKELEESNVLFRNDVVSHYETFFKKFCSEQIKTKKAIEKRCVELISENLNKCSNNAPQQKPQSSRRASSISLSPQESTVIGDSRVHIADYLNHQKLQVCQNKIQNMETQQKQLLSSFSDSFKSVWETVHLLIDKVNKFEDRDNYFEGMNEEESFLNQGFNIKWKNHLS